MGEPAGLAILVPAAGRGSRAGAGIPKQYKKLADRPLLALTLEALLRGAPKAAILPVIQKEDRALYLACAAGIVPKLRQPLMEPAVGGATRQESVRNGLEALAKLPLPPAVVLIHDAARPFVGPALIARAADAAANFGAAVPGLAPADTIKQVDMARCVSATLPRAQLRAIQTPQAFAFGLILEAHRRAALAGAADFTDDAAVAEWAGHRVHV
ncbi:MAG: 2-C-methyl-D-erythritol 4-phosphate cytidylyltransferase, partial [Methylocapsa sp.]|nr:2-C-methyl-D-erythritol 4-phosphate cytidylyltransferase [Methylocapsa sp.]